MPHTEGPAPELFTLSEVTFVAGGRPILDHVSDHVHEGHVTAIVGPERLGEVDAAADAQPAGGADIGKHQFSWGSAS